MNRKTHTLARMVTALLPLLLATVPPLTLHAQHRGELFNDNFEAATGVSPYTIEQQKTNATFRTDSDPNNATLGTWFTYGGEADGFTGLFGIQVTSNVDVPPPYTGTYQGSNVLRIFRSPVGSGSATCANFISTQIGGKVRATWKQMIQPAGNNAAMIHFSGTANPGSEGFDTARLSFLTQGGVWKYFSGGWQTLPIPETLSVWQDCQLDVDLDNQKWTLTIGGVSSGEVKGFGNAPGNTARSMTFRGGGSANDLWFIDSLQVYPLTKPIGAAHTPTDGQKVETFTPVIYTITDGFTETKELVVNTSTVQLLINGSRVTPNVLTKVGDTTTVSYLAPGDWTANTTNTVRLTFSDTNSPPGLSTNNFNFVVLPALAANPPRQQADSPDGLLVVEAEHYDRKVASVETPLLFAMDWEPTTDPAGYSGDGAMQALPGSSPDANMGSGPVDNSPRMDYKVRFLRTGTHYVWVRGYAPVFPGPPVSAAGANDSLFVGLDGNFMPTAITGFLDTSANPAYTWSTTTFTLVPSVGYHFITVWMRENGLSIDKIVITSNPNYRPEGVGPSKSPVGPDSSYWRFEEASGLALDVDENPAPFPGVLLGGASRSNSVFAAVVPHNAAANTKSMNFTGVEGDAVDMGAAGLDVGSGDFTLQAWINPRSITHVNGGFIAGKRISGLFGDKGYELLITPSGAGFKVRAAIRAGGPQVTAESGELGFGQWYHVAAVRGGGNLKVYVDGVQAGSVADTLAGISLNSGAQHFSVGGCLEGGTCPGDSPCFHTPFNGFIDEVRLTVAALPPAELLNAPAPSRPAIASRSPAPGATGVPGNANIVITLVDGTLPVVQNSIQLSLNNAPVTPVVTKTNTTTTVFYDPPTDLPGGSVNTVRLVYDDGTPGGLITNSYSFTIAYVPISGPSYWRFEEASGNALDSLGPFPGTLSGNAVRAADVPVATVLQTGAANTKSMSFDGAGAPSTIGTAVDMGAAVQVISSDFTLECWVKVTGTPNGAAIIVGKYQTGLFADKYFSLNHSAPTAGQVSFVFGMTGGNTISSGLKSQNQWYHVAGVRQGTAIRIYVDGVLQNSGTLNAFQDFTSDQRFCVAGGASGGVANMQGLVDEVRLSNTALAPAFFLNSTPPAVITVSRNGNQLTLSWTVTGYVLQDNDDVTNPLGWTNVPGGGTSPVVVTTSATKKFYRLKQ